MMSGEQLCALLMLLAALAMLAIAVTDDDNFV
jgi:hypothetical protein